MTPLEDSRFQKNYRFLPIKNDMREKEKALIDFSSNHDPRLDIQMRLRVLGFGFWVSGFLSS